MGCERRLAAMVLGLVMLVAGVAWPACTATFTADGTGTFPQTLKFADAGKGLTIDLSGMPPGAKVFRAELMLRGQRDGTRPVMPTRVYVDGQAEKPLKFVGPRFAGLDALDAVAAAMGAKQPLKLRVECTAGGVTRLEVSYVDGATNGGEGLRVSGIAAAHRAGQTLLTFAEPKLEAFPELATGADVRKFRDELAKKHAGLTFRIWRSAQRITAQSIASAQLVGECGLMTAWNSGYWQDDTDKRPALRYSVKDGGEPVAWGTGIYAHNPEKAGKAYYAVTVAADGREDFAQLGDGNATAEAVDEVVGLGVPVLQWKEEVAAGKEWMYRKGPITRLIYTRWESWPNAATPSKPIDYLVCIPPAVVDPAPVGLHLHCWGGSVNGGYGWWYNGDRGAIFIASNQVPYDWWTGYHEAIGTSKTFGDGQVRPFTMTRVFSFLDWAARQWQESPGLGWRKLDLTRVFTAGASMGGSGAPMYAVRFGDRIAWAIAWVGVHVPEDSPGFKSSYLNSYGPRDAAITMPDGRTSPWDYYSDVWWMRNNMKSETGLIIASNGKNDGGIGWPQAVAFARALQETRRPHVYNWAMNGHGTRTRIGADMDLDVRTDQSLPAFTHCTLDSDIGTARKLSDEEISARKAKIAADAAAGKPKGEVDVFDGDAEGQYNAYLSWQTEDVVDKADAWEMTVVLQKAAPKDECKVDLTPRRVQKLKTAKGQAFAYTVTDLQSGREIGRGTATADEYDLVTLKQITVAQGKNRVKMVATR